MADLVCGLIFRLPSVLRVQRRLITLVVLAPVEPQFFTSASSTTTEDRQSMLACHLQWKLYGKEGIGEIG